MSWEAMSAMVGARQRSGEMLTKRRRWRRRRTHVNSRTLPGPLAILGPFPPVSVIRRDVNKNETLHIRLGSFGRCSREVA